MLYIFVPEIPVMPAFIFLIGEHGISLFQFIPHIEIGLIQKVIVANCLV